MSTLGEDFEKIHNAVIELKKAVYEEWIEPLYKFLSKLFK